MKELSTELNTCQDGKTTLPEDKDIKTNLVLIQEIRDVLFNFWKTGFSFLRISGVDGVISIELMVDWTNKFWNNV